MAEYLSPGVYAENVLSSNMPIEAVGASTGGFVGISARGAVNVPTFISSWQGFLDKFAHGLETPFLANSDLAYAVYGFFQNGGTRCYIIRTASSKATKASAKNGETTFYANDEGTWGNKLKIKIVANAVTSANFDITVSYNGEVVEEFTNVSNDSTNSEYFVDILGKSKFINCPTGTLTVTTNDVAFTGGEDGINDIADTDYEKSLNLFDSVEDVNLICVPGQVSETMTKLILTYAENRGNVYAIVDGAKSADLATIKAFRAKLSCKNGALYYPWIRVSDPLSKTGKLRDCPPCGHIMGVYARTIQERGVWKAPAGTEAIVRGAIEVVQPLIKGDLDTINPLGINAIIPKTNYGIVIWGARGLHPDSSMRYVSDVLLNVNIKESIKNGTQWAVFEPNNNTLWSRVATSAQAFLDTLWRDGGLAGTSASEAYFVKCDKELNTDDVVNAGKLICEIGYAPNKPAEFVIFRISHSMSSN